MWGALLTTAAWIAACIVLWAIGQALIHYRWVRFLKRVDQLLSDRADGTDLTAPDELKVFHIGTDSTRRRNDHVRR